MSNRSTLIRIPRETKIKLKMKKENIERRYKELYGKQRQLHLTSLMNYMVQKPIFIQDEELNLLFNNKMRGKKNKWNIL